MLSLFNFLCLLVLSMTMNAADIGDVNSTSQDQGNQSVNVVNQTLIKLGDLCKLINEKSMLEFMFIVYVHSHW
jgi:hypothetical protein